MQSLKQGLQGPELEEDEMTLNDYYYGTVAKQHAADLQAEAAQTHLAKIARQANKRERAARREVRRLHAAVHGQGGLRHALRTLFVPQAETNDQVAGSSEQRVAEKPTTAGTR